MKIQFRKIIIIFLNHHMLRILLFDPLTLQYIIYKTTQDNVVKTYPTTDEYCCVALLKGLFLPILVGLLWSPTNKNLASYFTNVFLAYLTTYFLYQL